jgi:hypothetical protein
MTAINETKCDNCSRQTVGNDLAGWRQVWTDLVAPGVHALDFCGWECVRDYARAICQSSAH